MLKLTGSRRLCETPLAIDNARTQSNNFPLRQLIRCQTNSVLIVDDEPQIGRVMRTGLSTHGFEVRVAADGEQRWIFSMIGTPHW